MSLSFEDLDNHSDSDSGCSQYSSENKPGSPHTPQQSETVFPPSSGGFSVIQSSPIVGTRDQRKALRNKKVKKKRKATLQQIAEEQAETKQAARKLALQEVMAFLHSKNLIFWDLLEYVFNPENQQGETRHHEFFINDNRATTVLDWWLSSQNRGRQAKNAIRQWIMDFAVKKVSREARKVTKSQKLQTMGHTINSQAVKDFDFGVLNSMLQDSSSGAPFAMRILESFATSRHSGKHTENRRTKTHMVITSAALLCLGKYSHANNLSKKMLSLYLYASGAQRQCITILSTLGICESYSNLMSKNIKKKRKAKAATSTLAAVAQDPASDDNPFIDQPSGQIPEIFPTAEKERTGTIYQLSDSMRAEARELAATGLYSETYDNVNIGYKNAEQIIGRHDSQENGTASTIVPLFDAKIEDLDLETFQTAFFDAPPLKLEDIILMGDEQAQFHQNLIHTILRIIVKHGGPGLQKFQKNVDEDQPASSQKIPVHQSKLHPLPTWPIDESTIIGNAEVDEAVVKELKLDTVPNTSKLARVLAGDQLTIARLCALEYNRANQEEGYPGYFWGAWIPGLFHAKLADAHGTLLNHLGKSDSGAQNPGSLAFHNTRLDRLPVTATSLPTFHTCRDLIFVSLYARVLHCLLLVSKCKTLEEYSVKTTKWEMIVNHATSIYEQFANTQVVEDLRSAREGELKDKDEGTKPTKGDAVFENAVLFMRDALISREFNDAIKAGDLGRVVLVLKTFALSFRGNGRTKYAYEMLHLIHNLTHAWPPAIRDIVLKNWMVNPSGLPNRFVELDLMQEHLNFKIKVAYKARGSNASWDWLETISPCVVALSDLQKSFNSSLGGDQGILHAEVDLQADIQSLMDCLKEYKVYLIIMGRILGADEIAKEVLGTGFKNLTAGDKNPLSEFIDFIEKLKKRRKMIPVTTKLLNDMGKHNSPTGDRDLDSASQPLLQAHNNSEVDPESSDSEGSASSDSQEGSGSQKKTEIEGILEDLEKGVLSEPTLARTTEADVAYNMDEVIVEVSDNEEDSDDSEDDGEISESSVGSEGESDNEGY